MKYINIFFISILFSQYAISQPQRCYFQQRITYNMDITLLDETNSIEGKQQITYYNNSTDTLKKIYFHLYWNAFQPNSMMDLQSRDISDPDRRLLDKISKFDNDDGGYQKVLYVKKAGINLEIKEHETILEVMLDKPLLPLNSVNLETFFKAQIPNIVRRGGKNNSEGIQYSMSQWYPKICEFDRDGWHLNPYIMREFYGVWGDYHVNINAPTDYIVPATGYLSNEDATPLNLTLLPELVEQERVTWKYEAKNVHDFVWAADKNYNLIVRKVNDSLILKFFFNDFEDEQNWAKTADKLVEVYPFIAKTFGEYPFKEYSFIQGGDGGMEYPMATLVKNSSLGTAIHEWMHSWYQMVLGFNESYYSWMDEGFTSYASNRCSQYLTGDSLNTNRAYYNAYFNLVNNVTEEPLTTHADHYITNRGYRIGAYVKGQIFLDQLGYIVGDKMRDKVLKEYYNTFSFTHPDADDFFRLAEKITGFNLKWYKENWIYTTKTIDYSISTSFTDSSSTAFSVVRKRPIPMPLDIVLTLKNKQKIYYYIPIYYAFASKKEIPNDIDEAYYLSPASWINPELEFSVPYSINDIQSIEIDPSQRLADIDRTDNILYFY